MTPELETPPAQPRPWTSFDEHSRQLASHGERLAVIESKQGAFSAALDRVEETLQSGLTALGAKLDRVNGWLLGSLFTLCLALVGMIVNLLWKKGP